jgi:hypothetical protein
MPVQTRESSVYKQQKTELKSVLHFLQQREKDCHMIRKINSLPLTTKLA